MSRFLLIALLLLGVWIGLEVALRRFAHSPTGRRLSSIWRAVSAASSAASNAAAGGRRRASAGSASTAPRALVRCAVCSVHVDREKSRRVATPAGERIVCSEGCARAALDAAGGRA